ncbi:MAG TPA: toll/interleukin-1 receptor domain-containing protein, partial [Roseiflexaceae bacterium]
MADRPADVYISYSHNDEEFVRRLYEALRERGKLAWFDREALSPGTDWQQQIDTAIDTANTFTFVISPESLASRNCAHDLEQALQRNKLIIPILYRPVASETMPPALARRTWVDFTSPEQFDHSLAELIVALDQGGAVQQSDIAQQIATTAAQAQESAVTIQLLSEGSTTPDELPATAALARLLARATRINHGYEEKFDVTFSSILLAFLADDDPLSRWFQRYVREANIAVDALMVARKLDRATLDRDAAQPVAAQELDVPRRQTSSARALFEAAREFSETISRNSDEPLDVCHLMAAYIYRPAGHEGDLTSLRFVRPAWS